MLKETGEATDSVATGTRGTAATALMLKETSEATGSVATGTRGTATTALVLEEAREAPGSAATGARGTAATALVLEEAGEAARSAAAGARGTASLIMEKSADTGGPVSALGTASAERVAALRSEAEWVAARRAGMGKRLRRGSVVSAKTDRRRTASETTRTAGVTAGKCPESAATATAAGGRVGRRNGGCNQGQRRGRDQMLFHDWVLSARLMT